jgi:hypothetical protein
MGIQVMVVYRPKDGRGTLGDLPNASVLFAEFERIHIH